jgi:hypothetical protein
MVLYTAALHTFDNKWHNKCISRKEFYIIFLIFLWILCLLMKCFVFAEKINLLTWSNMKKIKKNKFIQPRPEVLLLLLNIQLTTAKGHHLVLYNFCLNFPRNQRVNLYQYWGESFLGRCLSKLYPTILPIIQHHVHCYLQITYRANKVIQHHVHCYLQITYRANKVIQHHVHCYLHMMLDDFICSVCDL